MIESLSQISYKIDVKKIFNSFYKNNLICLSAEKSSNGYYLGRMIIDLDESKKGISHTLIRNYLVNVRKQNHLVVNDKFHLSQSKLQSQYDTIFTNSAKYIQKELITIEQLLKESDGINGAYLVLVEDGTIQFINNDLKFEEIKKSEKKLAYIGKVINVQGNDILNEVNDKNQIVLKNMVPYKQVMLNKLLLILSGCIGFSIFSDIYSKELKMNLLNPLIKNESELNYIYSTNKQEIKESKN